MRSGEQAWPEPRGRATLPNRRSDGDWRKVLAFGAGPLRSAVPKAEPPAFSWRVSRALGGSTEARALLAAEPQSVGKARALLRRVLNECGVDGQRAHDAVLVASELVANAIRHGSRFGDTIEFQITVRVRDSARTAATPHFLPAKEKREAGGGLSIIAQLASWSNGVIGRRREVHAEMKI
jgi:anti-sigma regulatory factor (Ser/Thr protein kinase)